MYKQELRNALCEIGDAARQARNTRRGTSELVEVFNLIARLAQIVREEIVK